MAGVRRFVRSFRLEIVWLLGLLVVAAAYANLAPTASASSNALCYYDPFFNWCFQNHLPLDCLCDI